MPIRVLLIDDNDANRLTLAALLESEGFQVTEGSSLTDARKSLAEAQLFDLVLLDRHLRDGLGPELIPLVRARLPRCKVIVVSGSQHCDQSAATEHADGYFGKGDDLERLFEKIQTLLTIERAAAPG